MSKGGSLGEHVDDDARGDRARARSRVGYVSLEESLVGLMSRPRVTLIALMMMLMMMLAATGTIHACSLSSVRGGCVIAKEEVKGQLACVSGCVKTGSKGGSTKECPKRESRTWKRTRFQP